MRYLPHTESETQQMLGAIGVRSLDELFATIPAAVRAPQQLDLPAPASESELMQALGALARANADVESWDAFLGGGCYNHYHPAVIQDLLRRGEFLTPYTPYQPEVGQGTLQVIFEYQSMMCELLDLDVANASNYDLSYAAVEAVLMAMRVTQRNHYCVIDSVHPEYRAVVHATLGQTDRFTAHLVASTPAGGIDREALAHTLRAHPCAACLVQYPSVFGAVEDLRPIAQLVHDAGALLIVATADPTCFGLLESPGALGADIAIAEGQPLGLPPSYGGPYVGIFATRQQFIRNMPGRIAGLTADTQGRRGFVLALSAREQHIRREKATSNMCTNQQLCALAVTIYTAWLGKVGLQKLAWLNWEKAEYAKQLFASIPGVTLPYTLPTFHEFVITLAQPVDHVLAKLREHHILGGIPLGRWYPQFSNNLLVCVTEQNAKASIDRYAAVLREVATC